MKFLYAFILLLLVSSCASKNPVAGYYSGLYEITLSESVSCHFLMKKDEKAAIPTVLCHNADQAWAVPILDFAGSAWLLSPLLTQSETLIAFLEAKDADKVSVLVSTDKGRNWDISPMLKKKASSDKLTNVSITKVGRLEATFSTESSKDYKVEQEASFKSQFTPVKIRAKSYGELCFEQHLKPSEQKIPPECLSGYLARLLKE